MFNSLNLELVYPGGHILFSHDLAATPVLVKFSDLKVSLFGPTFRFQLDSFLVSLG